MIRRQLLPVIVIFLIITGLLFATKSLLQEWSADFNVLMAGNCILFLATLFSFFLFSRGIQKSSTHAFIRMTYSGMLLRMGICIIAALFYAWASGGRVNKFAIFGCFVFYFVYTFAEVKILVRLSKEQKNA